MLIRLSIAMLFCAGLMLYATQFVVSVPSASPSPASLHPQMAQNREIIVDHRVSQVAYQQDVDHFSNDARAMSPRSWGTPLDGSQGEPTAPQVTFDSGVPVETPTTPLQAPQLAPPSSPMRQVESSRLKEPQPFFEQNPLDPNSNALDSSEYSSPLPMELGNQKPDEELKSRLESDPPGRLKTEYPIGQSNEQLGHPPLTHQHPSQPSYIESPTPDHTGFGATNYGREVYGPPILDSDAHVIDQGCRSGGEIDSCVCDSCVGNTCQKSRCFLRFNRRKQNRDEPSMCGNDDCNTCLPAKYNQHLGHRYDYPVSRGTLDSSATKFSFEEDGDFPPANEILAKSIFWSEFDFMFLQPSFQNNTAITASGPQGVSQPFNFDLEPSFRVAAGFESEFGPGFAVDYFQFDNNSEFANFTSDGVITGTTSVYQLGPNVWTDLIADDFGESLNAFHSLEVHSTSVYAFKAIKFKRAYVNGRFGVQIASVEQILRARLSDAAGNGIGQLNHISNINAFGPRFGIDYVRKIGHTPAQLIASATTSLLFGDRDQFVENSATGELSRIGADEFLSVFDIFFGVQGKRIRGEKRNTTFRVGFVNQTWFGGGTGINPDGDFGFQGFSFMLGFNR